MFILFLVSALRHESVGTDIAGYIEKYTEYEKYAFKQIIKIYTPGLIP